jgi:hypothetical protein
MRGVYLMSISLINKLFVGCLFIWKNENYLINEITNVSDEHDIVNARIVNAKGEILALTCNQKEFKESVVK